MYNNNNNDDSRRQLHRQSTLTQGSEMFAYESSGDYNNITTGSSCSSSNTEESSGDDALNNNNHLQTVQQASVIAGVEDEINSPCFCPCTRAIIYVVTVIITAFSVNLIIGYIVYYFTSNYEHVHLSIFTVFVIFSSVNLSLCFVLRTLRLDCCFI